MWGRHWVHICIYMRYASHPRPSVRENNVSRIRLSPIHLSTRLSTLSTYLSYLSNYPSICASIYNVIWLMVNGILAHVASGSSVLLLLLFWIFFGGLGSLSIRKKNPSRVFLCFWILLSRFFSFSLSIWCFSLDWKFAQIEWNWMGIESGSVGGGMDWLTDWCSCGSPPKS